MSSTWTWTPQGWAFPLPTHRRVSWIPRSSSGLPSCHPAWWCTRINACSMALCCGMLACPRGGGISRSSHTQVATGCPLNSGSPLTAGGFALVQESRRPELLVLRRPMVGVSQNGGGEGRREGNSWEDRFEKGHTWFHEQVLVLLSKPSVTSCASFQGLCFLQQSWLPAPGEEGTNTFHQLGGAFGGSQWDRSEVGQAGS